MNERRICIIMNSVTGRMELNQHLVRSILVLERIQKRFIEHV